MRGGKWSWLEGRCEPGRSGGGKVDNVTLALLDGGICHPGGGGCVSGLCVPLGGWSEPSVGWGSSCSQQLKVHLGKLPGCNRGSRRQLHIYPARLISLCLGLGLSTFQPGWVLALFQRVRQACSGLQGWWRAAARTPAPAEGALTQPARENLLPALPSSSPSLSVL